METTSMTSTFISILGKEVKGVLWKLRTKSRMKCRLEGWRIGGDPGLIRTADTQFRKLLLYPSELRGHGCFWSSDIFDFTGFPEQQIWKLLDDVRSGPWRAGGHLSYGATIEILRDFASSSLETAGRSSIRPLEGP